MAKDLNEFYNEDFYNNNLQGMSQSAVIILGLLYEHYKPNKVIDIGCGQGAWLATAESFGAEIIKGLDGEWVNRERLLSKNIDFEAVNFDETMPELNEKYDLCISLEVAEHISKMNAENFINLLCEASDTVLFSAAIKQQGGENHINEQWQSYWVNLFNANDYECFDYFRGKIWDNDLVEWWYKQNIFLFIKKNSSHKELEVFKSTREPILDIAHPENYEQKANRFFKYDKLRKTNEKLEKTIKEKESRIIKQNNQIKQQNDKMNKIKSAKGKVVRIKALTHPIKKYRAYKNLIKEISKGT